MAFYTPAGTKVLNLPEQVQKNLEDIADLKTAQTALEASKQDASTAVTKESLTTDISGKDVDLGATSVTSLTNTGNTTNNGTLDQEGSATFGSDVEVDGNVTLNSPENIKFKTGSLDFSELTSFINTYNREAYQFKFAGTTLHRFVEEGQGNVFNPVNSLPNIVNATEIRGLFLDTKTESDDQYIVLPVFKNTVGGNIVFSGSTIKRVVLNSMTISGGYWFYNNSSTERVELADGAEVKYTGYGQLFNGASAVSYIGAIDMSGAHLLYLMFGGCHSLKEIHCTHWKLSFDISASTRFEEASLVEIIGNLDTVSTAQTLTMGSTNLAKLTEDEILVATGKGWTLA